MKAIICTKYGSPNYLELREVAKPSPKDNEILIRICATTANAADTRMRSAQFPALFWLPMRLMLGFKGPRNIMGLEFAGEIESIGKDVKLFKKGDQLFGSSGMGMGTYAEYKCLPEDEIVAIKRKHSAYPQRSS